MVDLVHDELLELLACPECGGSLEEAKSTPLLRCLKCSQVFPIVNGVPDFTSPREQGQGSRVVRHFEEEFRVFADGDEDFDSEDVLEYLLFTRLGLLERPDLRGLDPYPERLLSVPDFRKEWTQLKGKRVLEVGCGAGRLTSIAATGEPELLIGLDPGAHIYRALDRCGEGSAYFVRGSILKPPLKIEIFDYIYSVGVLHHLTSISVALAEMVRLLKSGGSCSVWVYPNEYWGRGPQVPLSKIINKHLSKKGAEDSLRFCERYLLPLGKAQRLASRLGKGRYFLAPLFALPVPRHTHEKIMLMTIFDHFGPSIINTFTQEELGVLMQEVNLVPVRRSAVATGWFAHKP